MSFSLDKFYQLNRRALIWIILIGVLWLLRDFFGLIFITFFLTFVATPLIRLCDKWLKLPSRLSLLVIYILFLVVLGSFIRYVTPSVISEANRFLTNLNEFEDKLIDIERGFSARYPGFQRSLHGYLRSTVDEDTQNTIVHELGVFKASIGITDQDFAEYVDNESIPASSREKIERYYHKQADLLVTAHLTQQADKVREQLPKLINQLYRGSGTILLALLFSFLILFDSARLSALIKSLNLSRLHDFYAETAQPVIRFTYVVGRAIQAQAIIACVNTLLTFIGLFVLDVPSLALLSLIVFVCSFIPVLGVVISTMPIALFALNAGGSTLVMAVIALVVGVHAVEAYGLNPLIYGKHLKLNPVLVLIILLIAYHGFGLWGMLLGVPVAHYFIHDVFGVPLWDEKRLKPLQ